jgi:2-octaprenyl-6-methoxyphenol hydroxylase
VNSVNPPSATADARAALDSVDVLIIGGGFVGGTLACALAHAGLTSVVVEAGNPRAALDAGFDGRASAIALTSRRLLQAVGVWPAMAADAHPMLDIRVSDGPSRLFLHYAHDEVGEEPFGHMVENRHLRRAILERMEALDGVRLLAGEHLERLERGPQGVIGWRRDGSRIRARLAVAADGRNSPTREDAGIAVTGWRYDQAAIVCTVAHALAHRSIAHEHFLPAGPFAILPLNGDRSSLVWTERAAVAPAMMALDDEAFLDELGQRFGDFLGALRLIGPRFSYPLSLQYAQAVTARRLALVGDAAHAMHPIAGQGLNMGFRDVASLVDALAEARRRGEDLGAAATLERFARARRFDNALMLAATDGLNRLFSNAIPPVRLARDLGLAAVNRLPAVKRVFMRHAMGTMGDLPSLMRG